MTYLKGIAMKMVFFLIFTGLTFTHAFASSACESLSGAEYICQKLDGFLKISYEPKKNRVAFISVDGGVEIASWYSTMKVIPVIIDTGDGMVLTTPEIKGKVTCEKNSIKFETFNTLDHEKTTQYYIQTSDGMIVKDNEEGTSIVCKQV